MHFTDDGGKMGMGNQVLRGIVFLSIISNMAWAGGAVPECLSKKGNQPIAINNEQVEQWKQSTANGYLARAHVQGVVTQVYPDEHGHNHFQIAMDSKQGDTLEVIYNIEFGQLPQITKGMNVEACGDYITSDAATNLYPASPDGAIIHWIHKNPRSGHPSGFLTIDGVVYGQGEGDAKEGDTSYDSLYPSKRPDSQ